MRKTYLARNLETNEVTNCNSEELSKLLGIAPTTIRNYISDRETLVRNGYEINKNKVSNNQKEITVDLLAEWDSVTKRIRRAAYAK